MRLLLDSHVFIWMDISPSRLSAKAQAALSDPNNEVFLSYVSIWEMQIKIQLGKLSLNSSLPKAIKNQRNINDMALLPIRVRHIFALQKLPHHHGDPFDRLLIAQAQTEQLTFVTDDAKIQLYSIKVLW
jgi:PIN domain nuclease of toxin-antitoxin system